MPGSLAVSAAELLVLSCFSVCLIADRAFGRLRSVHVLKLDSLILKKDLSNLFYGHSLNCALVFHFFNSPVTPSKQHPAM
jgi:hypothetical protein